LLGERLGHQRVDVVEQDDVLLAREVAEERAAGDVGGSGDVVHRGGGVAAVAEQAQGMTLELGACARLLPLSQPACSHPRSMAPARE